MSKGLKGFLIGIFVVAVVFCLFVVIRGSMHDRNFVEEIKSWDRSEQQQEIPEENKENQPASQLQIGVEDNLIVIK